jgi:hypothetical protein
MLEGVRRGNIDEHLRRTGSRIVRRGEVETLSPPTGSPQALRSEPRGAGKL